jgi:hypothetical protein
MRFIKLGLISAVFLFLVITAISLLLPSTINISRAIDVNAPYDSVYANLNDVSKWRNWVANYDSANTTISERSTGKGATITMNKTSVTITESRPDKIETSWTSGSKSLQGAFNIIKQQNSSLITVQWHFVQKAKWYPWEKFASIVSDKVMSPVMERSLDNLKKVVEK